MGRFTFLEDAPVSDCAVDIEGKNLDDVFETAAAALVELMVDPATVRLTVARRITLQAAQLDLLLYDWLSELIFRKDRDREVFPSCRACVGGDGPFRLTAEVRGGVIEPARTALGADPKGVTFHQFRLDRVEDGWRARVVIDI